MAQLINLSRSVEYPRGKSWAREEVEGSMSGLSMREPPLHTSSGQIASVFLQLSGDQYKKGSFQGHATLWLGSPCSGETTWKRNAGEHLVFETLTNGTSTASIITVVYLWHCACIIYEEHLALLVYETRNMLVRWVWTDPWCTDKIMDWKSFVW